MGFARKTVAGRAEFDNIIEGDFLELPPGLSVEQLIDIPTSLRDEVEASEGRRLAKLITDRLPREEETLRLRMEHGYALASDMNWENVVKEYLLPSLDKVASEK